MSVGRQYPQGSISTPTHAVSAPYAPAISLSFAPFGQYPVAHRPSVPRWLAGGSRAVSTPACEAGHSLVQPPPRASASNVQASEPRSSLSPPSESQRRYPGPVARLPRITGHRPPSLPAGPAPRTSALHRTAGSTRGRSRPRPAPPPQGPSSTGPQEINVLHSVCYPTAPPANLMHVVLESDLPEGTRVSQEDGERKSPKP